MRRPSRSAASGHANRLRLLPRARERRKVAGPHRVGERLGCDRLRVEGRTLDGSAPERGWGRRAE
eukprot:7072808-Alexandrium_andersonii.AAC.1